VFRRYPLVEVRLDNRPPNGAPDHPLIFVGNNKYETNLLAVRGRSALDRGELCLYLVKGRGRIHPDPAGLLSLLGRLEQDRDFWGTCQPEFRGGHRRGRSSRSPWTGR